MTTAEATMAPKASMAPMGVSTATMSGRNTTLTTVITKMAMPANNRRRPGMGRPSSSSGSCVLPTGRLASSGDHQASESAIWTGWSGMARDEPAL